MPYKNKKDRATGYHKWKLDRKRNMVVRARCRCYTKKVEFNLTIDDIDIPDYCPVLGIKLDTENFGRGNQDYKPSIDRIDAKKGYIKGNICIISGRANRIKSDATIAELEAILKYMKDV